MHRLQLAACLALLALGVLACGLLREAPDPVIDGWPIGTEVDCATRADCRVLLSLARDRLDARDPGHAAVARVTLRHEGTPVDPATGDRILLTRSGGAPDVAVFELEDGTVTAIGVGYPGISREPMAFDTGPQPPAARRPIRRRATTACSPSASGTVGRRIAGGRSLAIGGRNDDRGRRFGPRAAGGGRGAGCVRGARWRQRPPGGRWRPRPPGGRWRQRPPGGRSLQRHPGAVGVDRGPRAAGGDRGPRAAGGDRGPRRPVASEAPGRPVASEAPGRPVASEAPGRPVASEASRRPIAAEAPRRGWRQPPSSRPRSAVSDGTNQCWVPALDSRTSAVNAFEDAAGSGSDPTIARRLR